jgi:hypothetical protein
MKNMIPNFQTRPWRSGNTSLPIAAIAMLAVVLAAPSAVRAAPPLPGAIFTTDSTCSGVDLNIYGAKTDVYIDGGPAHPGAASMPDGCYYVQVTSPEGTVLGTSVGSSNEVPFCISSGEPQDCYQLWNILVKASDQSQGYDDTTNAGGEYKVWVSTVATFDNNSTKTDNFKVREGGGGLGGTAELCVEKFYDANANGIWDASESEITGWEFTIFGTIGFDTVQLPHTNTPWCGVVDPDTFHITEGTPIELNWVHTTPTMLTIAVGANEHKDAIFGNVCLGAGGGLTLGFWSNKNGQSLERASDFNLLSALCLVNANGVHQTWPADTTAHLATAKTNFSSWLLSATATNMAYMLSAQLAAMELNVSHNGVSNKFGAGVNGNSLVYAPCLLDYTSPVNNGLTGLNTLGFISISNLMAAANQSLCDHPVTKTAGSVRSYQECLKNALDDANNNRNFTQSSPCDFSFPTN